MFTLHAVVHALAAAAFISLFYCTKRTYILNVVLIMLAIIVTNTLVDQAWHWLKTVF